MWVFPCFWCKCQWPLPSVNKRKIKNSPQTAGKNKKKEGKGLSVIWKWLFHDFTGPLLFPWPHSFKHTTQQQRSAQAANLTWTWTSLQTDEGQDLHVLPNLELLNYLPGLPVIPSMERNTSSLDGEGTLFRKLPRDVALCSTSQLCTEHSWLEVSLSMKNRETKASVISMPPTEIFFLLKDHSWTLSKLTDYPRRSQYPSWHPQSHVTHSWEMCEWSQNPLPSEINKNFLSLPELQPFHT